MSKKKIIRISNNLNVPISSHIIMFKENNLIIYTPAFENKNINRKISYKTKILALSKDNKLIKHNINYNYTHKNKNKHTYMYTNYIARCKGKNIDIDGIEYLAFQIKNKNKTEKIYSINYENCTFEILDTQEFNYLSKILSVWPVSHCPEKNSFVAFYFMDKIKINLFLDNFATNMAIKLLAKFFKTYNGIENYVSIILTDDLLNQIKKDFENLEELKNKNLFSYYIFSAYKIYIKYRNMIYVRCKVLADEIISSKTFSKNKLLNIQNSNPIEESFKNETIGDKYEILNRILNKYNLTPDDVFKSSNKFLKYRQKIQEEIKEHFDLEEIFK